MDAWKQMRMEIAMKKSKKIRLRISMKKWMTQWVNMFKSLGFFDTGEGEGDSSFVKESLRQIILLSLSKF